MSKSIVEEWKDVVGFEGLYQVSSEGRVRSVSTMYTRTVYGHELTQSHGSKRILNACDNGNGYLYVTLNKQRKKHNKYVHRLVAEAFLDGCDCGKQVNHKDHDRKNNNVSNLEWVTQQDNIQYSVPLMRHPHDDKRTNKNFGKGIRIKNGKYEVYICQKYLGRHLTLSDAQIARD